MSKLAKKNKRAKEVFTTGEIAHLWIHAEQRRARNPQCNFSFSGDNLCSYSTNIATIIRKRGNIVAALHLNRRFSSTTCIHQSYARFACNQFPMFHVSEFPDSGHKNNLADYRKRIATQALKAQRAKSRKEWELTTLNSLVAEANGYSKLFGLATKFQALTPAELEKLEIAAREESKKQSILRAEADERQRIAAAQRLQLVTGNLQYWLQGSNEFGGWYFRTLPFSYLRVILTEEGTVVQTTQGANVPLSHVQRAIPLVLKLMDRGEQWQRNGHSIHLGYYQIDRITAEGQVIAGCHKFEATEVKRFAKVLESLPVELATTTTDASAPEATTAV